MNTQEYIPYDSVSGIILINEEAREYPSLSGTGFFAYIQGSENIFFITARHCIMDPSDRISGEVAIPHTPNSDGPWERVDFARYLTMKYNEGTNDFHEDVIVLVVGETTDDQKETLKKRALPLIPQKIVSYILDKIIEENDNIRLVGYPDNSKDIDYDDPLILAQPRGFYAKIHGKSSMINCYEMKEKSWKEGSLSGFSGSPILALIPKPDGSISALPLGILITENIFLSINVATDLILEFLEGEKNPEPTTP